MVGCGDLVIVADLVGDLVVLLILGSLKKFSPRLATTELDCLSKLFEIFRSVGSYFYIWPF